MPDAFELTPAIRDYIQKLLRREDVEQLVLSKGPPAEVGLKRRGIPMRWFPGRSFFAALELAESSLNPRAAVAVEDDLP